MEKRIDHVVMGEESAKLAVRSCGDLVMPMSATGTTEGVQRFVILYRRVVSRGKKEENRQGQLQPCNTSTRSENGWSIPRFCGLGSNFYLPFIALGKYKMGKSVTTETVKIAFEMGIHAVDTAPIYYNEDQVGNALAQQNGIVPGSIGSEDDIVAINTGHAFCIVKVPKRATSAEQVKKELVKSLDKLQRTQIDLLLLHWPCDVIAMDTLKQVWSAMEGKVRALGVCNFNKEALRLLLCHCQNTRPSVLQVKRHVMLPQWDLVDFCNQHDILLQAHSPLG